jgi:hypothetical protein
MDSRERWTEEREMDSRERWTAERERWTEEGDGQQ